MLNEIIIKANSYSCHAGWKKESPGEKGKGYKIYKTDGTVSIFVKTTILFSIADCTIELKNYPYKNGFVNAKVSQKAYHDSKKNQDRVSWKGYCNLINSDATLKNINFNCTSIFNVSSEILESSYGTARIDGVTYNVTNKKDFYKQPEPK